MRSHTCQVQSICSSCLDPGRKEEGIATLRQATLAVNSKPELSVAAAIILSNGEIKCPRQGKTPLPQSPSPRLPLVRDQFEQAFSSTFCCRDPSGSDDRGCCGWGAAETPDRDPLRLWGAEHDWHDTHSHCGTLPRPDRTVGEVWPGEEARVSGAHQERWGLCWKPPNPLLLQRLRPSPRSSTLPKPHPIFSQAPPPHVLQRWFASCLNLGPRLSPFSRICALFSLSTSVPPHIAHLSSLSSGRSSPTMFPLPTLHSVPPL